MVGNDIVDLSLADRNVWKRKRYLDKVLLPSEQELLFDAEDPGRFFWLLWSMKESAYKLHFRKHLIRNLNPLRFSCTSDVDLAGTVEVDNTRYKTRSFSQDAYVHTVATRCDTEPGVRCEVLSCSKREGVRKKMIHSLVRSFSEVKNLDARLVKFQKDQNGLPFLTDEHNGLIQACSMSHHGRFGAYAIAIEE